MCALYVFQGHKADAERKERQLEVLCQEYHDLQERVRNDQKRVDEALRLRAWAEAEVTRVRAEMRTVEDRRRAEHRNEDDLKRQLGETEDALKREQAETARLRRELSESETERAESERQRDEAARRNFVLSGDNDGLSKKVKNLDAKILKMIDTHAKHEAVERELKDRNAELREWLQKKEQARCRAEASLVEKGRTIEDLEKTLSKERRILNVERMARINAQQQVETLQRQLAAALRRIRDLGEEYRDEMMLARQRDTQMWAAREKNLELMEKVSTLERGSKSGSAGPNSGGGGGSSLHAIAAPDVHVFPGPAKFSSSSSGTAGARSRSRSPGNGIVNSSNNNMNIINATNKSVRFTASTAFELGSLDSQVPTFSSVNASSFSRPESRSEFSETTNFSPGSLIDAAGDSSNTGDFSDPPVAFPSDSLPSLQGDDTQGIEEYFLSLLEWTRTNMLEHEATIEEQELAYEECVRQRGLLEALEKGVMDDAVVLQLRNQNADLLQRLHASIANLRASEA